MTAEIIPFGSPTVLVRDVIRARQALAAAALDSAEWRELAVASEAAWQRLVFECGSVDMAHRAMSLLARFAS